MTNSALVGPRLERLKVSSSNDPALMSRPSPEIAPPFYRYGGRFELEVFHPTAEAGGVHWCRCQASIAAVERVSRDAQTLRHCFAVGEVEEMVGSVGVPGRLQEA
jgi:hypothetical protein